MARANIETLLSLDEWARVMGFNPYEFNQIGTGLKLARDAQCQTVFYQYSWQKQFLSREEIAMAIAQSEEALRNELGFPIAPQWFEGELHDYPQRAAVSVGRTSNWVSAKGTWKSIPLENGYITALGKRTLTLIEADVAYVSSDTDGDSINDRFTATVNAAGLDVNKIRVYFPSAERGVYDFETYRIRPLFITYVDPVLTIIGSLSQLVKPSLTDALKPSSLDVAGAIYATAIDVYEEGIEADYGTAYWDRVEYLNCAAATDAISSAEITGTRRITPTINGSYLQGRAPNRLAVNYQAGYPLKNGAVNPVMAEVVARLATTYIPALSCGCDKPDQILTFWRSSPADTETGKRPMTLKEIDENIFGVTRGAIFAWQKVQQIKQSIGVGV